MESNLFNLQRSTTSQQHSTPPTDRDDASDRLLTQPHDRHPFDPRTSNPASDPPSVYRRQTSNKLPRRTNIPTPLLPHRRTTHRIPNQRRHVLHKSILFLGSKQDMASQIILPQKQSSIRRHNNRLRITRLRDPTPWLHTST